MRGDFVASLVHLLHHPVVAKLVRDVKGTGGWASIRVCVVIEALKVVDVINADGIVCSVTSGEESVMEPSWRVKKIIYRFVSGHMA